MAAIEGYTSLMSAAPGQVVDFHVRVTDADPSFSLQMVRRGSGDTSLLTRSGQAYNPGSQDDAALAVDGCDWPAVDSAQIVIPDDWRSGYYVAKLASGDAYTEIPLIVRTTPGSESNVVVKWSDTTAQAYNAWGGRSLYSTPFSPKVSYDRPYDVSLFEKYTLPFVAWLERNNLTPDYCSSLDLHTNPQLLAPYALFVSVGHDEYWSYEMRNQVEAFIAGGGNVCFLSANTCYWQVRFDFSNGGRIMRCYKETEGVGRTPDPERSDPRRVTVRWKEPPVNRPETMLTGVSYWYGAGWWNDPITSARYRGYTVRNASHWLFAGSGLSDGDSFGAGSSVDTAILGYETDATGPGTPAAFVTLASADLHDWAPGGQGGDATMGIYRRNGCAFTAGTVNWAAGYSDAGDSPVDTITANLLDAFANDDRVPVDLGNPGFEEWQNGSPPGWDLDGAGTVAAHTNEPSVGSDEFRYSGGGTTSAQIDASHGETWLSESDFSCDRGVSYGAGCWINASRAGATIRLQTTDTWTDFAVASHSGSGNWEYVFAAGTAPPGDGAAPARVKLQVAAGVLARYDNVSVFRLPSRA